MGNFRKLTTDGHTTSQTHRGQTHKAIIGYTPKVDIDSLRVVQLVTSVIRPIKCLFLLLTVVMFIFKWVCHTLHGIFTFVCVTYVYHCPFSLPLVAVGSHDLYRCPLSLPLVAVGSNDLYRCPLSLPLVAVGSHDLYRCPFSLPLVAVGSHDYIVVRSLPLVAVGNHDLNNDCGSSCISPLLFLAYPTRFSTIFTRPGL